MSERTLFALQRLSAAILAPLIIVHLLLIFYAVGNGLTAAEILGRTRGNFLWAMFYGLFVLAAAMHAPIGIRNILVEWTPLSRRMASLLALAFAVLLLGLGLRAVIAVAL